MLRRAARPVSKHEGVSREHQIRPPDAPGERDPVGCPE
jgi:hypothetical protein